MAKKIFPDILKDPSITPLQSNLNDADSGEVFLVEDRGRRYKLRICDDVAQARYIESNIMKVRSKGVMTHYIGRQGRNLLFEYIPGRDLRKDEDCDTVYKVGQIVGRVHAIKVQRPSDPDAKFHRSLNYLIDQELLDQEDKKKIEENFHRLKPEGKTEYSMDIQDINPSNFRKGDDGQVHLVDEENVIPNLKGYGFIKPFLHWFKDEHKRSFLEGYRSVADDSFFDDRFRQFVQLNYLVIHASKLHKKKRPCNKDLGWLRNLLEETEQQYKVGHRR
ncbi:MAG: hypothetical protein AABX47_04320 [Nanoarchaeota archaeon]